MGIKYSICFTGGFLSPSEQDVIERLTHFFSSIESGKVEELIRNKKTFKRSIDLALANKIKSRIEQAGAECLIFIESTESSKATPEPHAISRADDSSSKRSGGLIVISSIFLILCALLLSNGYEPRGGILWSLSESMYLYDGYPFGCGELEYHGGEVIKAPDGKLSPNYSSITITGGCSDSLHVEISTRYILFVFLCVGMFGVGRYFGAIKSMRYYREKIKAAIALAQA